MNYANIKYYDIANGPGVRTSVFVSGCRHHCPGCFNAVAWDFDYGQPFDKTVRNEVFASCQPDYIAGLSLLGGEPFEPENQRELLPFVRNFKALYPAKTVWCYSGYTWEQLTGKEPSPARCEVTDELLALLTEYYKDAKLISVDTEETNFLASNPLSDTNELKLYVEGNDERMTLISVFDNLGKGASGAAVENMNLVLGLDETTGLL